MKNKIIAKSLLFVLYLLASVSGYANEISKVVNVGTPGTLSDHITSTEKIRITNLTITGNLNSTDIKFIREMGGRNSIGETTHGKLTVLDLSGATIVKGGDPYYEDESYIYTATDNSIGTYMFYQCNFASVIIPNNATRIGNYTFWGCSNLTAMTIPKSVATIGELAFAGCTSLKSFTVSGENLVFLSFEDVLFNKDKTTLISYPAGKPVPDYIIPTSVKSIGDWAFRNCTNLISITISNVVTAIGTGAFWDCASLEKIAVSEGNPNYCSYENVLFNKDKTILMAFPNSKSNEYVIPTIATNIGRYAFGSCSNLTSVTIPDKVTKLDEYAFAGCSSLTAVVIPNGVTDIGKNAFRNCTGLNSIVIGNSVKSIGDAAFYNCSGLVSVTIPNSVTSIGKQAFVDCSKLFSVTIGNSLTNIGFATFAHCTRMKSIVIPSNVTSIEESAFLNCFNLASITVPSSVTSIGEYAFYNTAWFVEEQPAGIVYVNQVLYSCNGNMPANTSIAVDEGTVSISDGAFKGYANLISVTIPNSVKRIGARAFKNCMGLTSVTIPGSEISLGEQAFYGCKEIKKINSLNALPPVCGEDCFGDVTSALYVPIGSKTVYQNANEWKNLDPITESDFSSVARLNNDNIQVRAFSGKIIIENAPEGKPVLISNLAGQLVYQGTGGEIALGSGIYIVCVEGDNELVSKHRVMLK